MSFRLTILLYTVALVAALLALGVSLHLLLSRPDVAGAPPAATLALREPGAEVRRVMGQHIRNSPVSTCEDAYLSLAGQAVQGNAFAVASEKTSPSERLSVISSLIGFEIPSPEGGRPGIGLVDMTSGEGSCAGNYTRIVAVARSCEQLANTPPEGAKLMPPLRGIGLMTLPNQLRVLLMPVGDQCVVVTTGSNVQLN